MQATGLRLLLASATLLTASNAMALSLAPRVDETFEHCRAHAQGVIEQASCIAAETDRQDARLNRIYQQLLARLNPAQKTALVAAQRTWLQLRQQDATLETSLYEDSQPANLQAADTDMQRLRARRPVAGLSAPAGLRRRSAGRRSGPTPRKGSSAWRYA